LYGDLNRVVSWLNDTVKRLIRQAGMPNLKERTLP
jgi:hypothetical protein